MRYLGAAHVHFSGDVGRAQLYVGRARAVLGEVVRIHTEEGVGSLQNFSQTVELGPGVTAAVHYMGPDAVPDIMISAVMPVREPEEPEPLEIFLLNILDFDTRAAEVVRYDDLVNVRIEVLEEFLIPESYIGRSIGFCVNDGDVYRIHEVYDGDSGDRTTWVLRNGEAFVQYSYNGQSPRSGLYAKNVAAGGGRVYVQGFMPHPSDPSWGASWIDEYMLDGAYVRRVVSWGGVFPTENREEWFSYGGGHLWIGQESEAGYPMPGYHMLSTLRLEDGNWTSFAKDEGDRPWPVVDAGFDVGATFWDSSLGAEVVFRDLAGGELEAVNVSSAGYQDRALCLARRRAYFRSQEPRSGDDDDWEPPILSVHARSGATLSHIRTFDLEYEGFATRIETDGADKA